MKCRALLHATLFHECFILQFDAICCGRFAIDAPALFHECFILQFDSICCGRFAIDAICCSLPQFVANCCNLSQFVVIYFDFILGRNFVPCNLVPCNFDT